MKPMNAMLSVLFGTGLVILVYGLSFLPSASLGEIDDVEEILSSVDPEESGSNADAVASSFIDRSGRGTSST